MTDLALTFNPDTNTSDLTLTDGDLATDAGLRTAVILSLFTDRRAEESDEIPDRSDDPRGYWGDSLAGADGGTRPLGSRLWLIHREKITRAVLDNARAFAVEALAWLIEEGIAARNEIATSADGAALVIEGATVRPDGSTLTWRHRIAWGAHAV